MTTSTTIESFFIKGISVRTTNENGSAAVAIPQLWHQFIHNNIQGQLTGKTSNDIYCVYTNYEKDFTRPYTTIIGCRVNEQEAQQEGFTTITIEAGNYAVFTAKGNLQQGAVYNKWLEIWEAPVIRSYTTDFEVYDQKAAEFSNAEVDIFVATHQTC